LGRGLGALIPGASQPPPPSAPEPAPETWATVASITPNPFQPREVFDDPGLDELSASIRDKGLLQPLVVRRVGDGRYQLIAGERRLRAAQRAGLERVPIVVRDADDGEALELALVENLQRENLNPVEEARAYQRLCDEFGLSQEEIAQHVRKNRSTVTNSLRLLQLAPDVLGQVASGALTAGHARSLLGLSSAEAQTAVARDVIARRLSVRDTETLVRSRAQPIPADVEQRALESEIARALGTRVRLRHNKDGSGRIVIEYYSLDELDGVLARLGVRAHS
jgi:ParB family chromosome partitioning protein